ncbi:MAG: sigma-70 family RNA polymerase sigma factor [Lachnospiraceae bacterium]|nr:sigma-70 family RNA polymerase sigma factor [Lachnospiraceae bacterium]
MEHLVRLAKKGDADAFIRLIEINQDALKRIAVAWLRDENDIADVIQDTILDAYEHIGQLKKAEYFKTWLVRILINNCTKIYRKNKNHLQFEVSADEHTQDHWEISGSAESISADLEFFDLLKALPEDSRVIFQLYFGEQFTTAEIADMLHMKENTVKSKIRRGKMQLREQMEKER